MMRERMSRQRGTVLILVASGIIALLGAVGLSVDTGYIFTFKNQLQNAADAAALAGAQGLLADPSNYSPDSRAVQLAIAYAAQNSAGGQPVNLSPSEVSFPKGNIVRVEMTRPVNTFFMRVLGISQVNAQVKAAAAIVPATGGSGLRPLTLLDQFGHGSLCVSPNDDIVNNPPHGDFKSTTHTWRGVTVTADHYRSPYDSSFDGWDLSTVGDCGDVTGLIAPRDVDGQLVELKTDHWLTPGNFGPAALGQRGADTYEYNIVYGSQAYVQVSDILYTETGNMIGPTRSGITDLIAQDPGAHMVRTNAGRWAVVSDQYPMNESPRIIAIPMYSVDYAPGNGRTDFRVDSIGSFFIERSSGQYVYGRFVQSRLKNGRPGDAPRNSGSGTVSGGGRLLGTVQLVNSE
ncbi:MAG: hypothetical protein HY314_13270 [Acidobacteria bacterium]|nr:hypothetical protein [Acidobacteriota bacterium]